MGDKIKVFYHRWDNETTPKSIKVVGVDSIETHDGLKVKIYLAWGWPIRYHHVTLVSRPVPFGIHTFDITPRHYNLTNAGVLSWKDAEGRMQEIAADPV